MYDYQTSPRYRNSQRVILKVIREIITDRKYNYNNMMMWIISRGFGPKTLRNVTNT